MLQNTGSIQKNQLYCYTSHEQSQNEVKKTFPLNSGVKKNKIGILIKEVHDLYTDNCKTLLKGRPK